VQSTWAVRESMSRVPTRTPAQLAAAPLDEIAFDHLVAAKSRSSL
jgi:hypothetical protein